MNWAATRERLIVARGQRWARQDRANSKSAATVAFTISADGILLPPYVVFKVRTQEFLIRYFSFDQSKLFFECLPYGTYIQFFGSKDLCLSLYVLQSDKGTPHNTWVDPSSASGTIVHVSKSGWMNATVMEHWFMEVIVPWASALNGKKAIFLDNCSAHFSEAVIKECERLNIFFIPLPPNATWLTQPCDVALFKSVKTAWRAMIGEFNDSRVAQGLKPYETLPRPRFVEVLDLMIDRLKLSRDGEGLSQLIFKAFHATGIYPLNRNMVLKKLPVLASSSASARDVAIDDVRSVVSSSSSDRMMGAFVDAVNRPLFTGPQRGRGGRPLGPAGVPLTMARHKYVFFSFMCHVILMVLFHFELKLG
jgi:hypothetical protein